MDNGHYGVLTQHQRLFEPKTKEHIIDDPSVTVTHN